MRISTPTNIIRPANGFTLVELMIVLFIIGLAGSAVLLSVRSVKSNVGSQAEIFAGRVAALRDRSVTESRPFALWIRPSGYGFEERKGGVWSALDQKPFETTDWTKPAVAQIPAGRVLRIAFDSNGLPTAPLDLVVGSEGRTIRVSVNSAGDVDVSR